MYNTDGDLVVLVDSDGNDLKDEKGISRTIPKLTAHTEGVLHRSISIFVISSHNEIMLQKRSSNKYHSAGLWANTCCTHPRPNEKPIDAANRRLKEEMGITCELEEKFCFSYTADVGNDLVENEFDHVFFGFTDETPTINTAEAAEWKWIHVDELKAEIKLQKEKYAPWLRLCFTRVFTELQKEK